MDLPESLSFSSLLGQRRAKNLLGRILPSGRLAHAYLFRGPDGVGKRRGAILTAARLMCTGATADGGCGGCPSCLKLLGSSHPDVSLVAPEKGAITIDRIRRLCRELAYPPYESPLRVTIIEDVHNLKTEAANCLLKTLEEPPAQNLLILTAESSRAVLPTIVSRCQVIPFFRLSEEETVTVVLEHRPAIGAERAHTLAVLADGSPGLALAIEKTELTALFDEVRAVLDESIAGSASSVLRIVAAAAKMAELKEELPLFLGLLRRWVRTRMEKTAAAGEADGRLGLRRLTAIDRAERQLARNCNRGQVGETLLFNLQSSKPQV